MAGDPRFVSVANGDYTLQGTSPAIDAAIRFPGINDAFRGARPDMGASRVPERDRRRDAARSDQRSQNRTVTGRLLKNVEC